ncbi:hypothetical protein AMTRI_Chr06g172650 [Amborella trichopoda]|uniref:Uncharacterized protein n=1 Tax=Amborella trichopoda TaxID=13333 RepID=W1PPQ3_AMBTC|nr:hypothetical protein AMTR_s00013p00252180 [Amborella trichopoda]
MPSIMPMRRKKWTEEEERTLIDKYAEMMANGTLARMKTREKKFRPIASEVNLMHHSQDPLAFPWQWTWKDASTKVQNMRHQYLGVKQKIRKSVASDGSIEQEEFDWLEGLTHWPNFLRYKDVFGDVALGFNDSMNMENGKNNSGGCGTSEMGVLGLGSETDIAIECGNENGNGNGLLGLGLGFEYEGDEREENFVKDDREGFDYEEVEPMESRQRKKKRFLRFGDGGKGPGQVVCNRFWVYLANQFAQLREREARHEEREVERERERQRREQFRLEAEEERERNLEECEREREEREQVREKSRQEWVREWEAMERESAEREKRRREEDLLREREWEERMERRRLEWRKKMDDMLSQHRVAMDQIQARIVQEQQNLINQLLGFLSQWTGHSGGLSDHPVGGNPYLSQMMQNMHHVNGIVHGEGRASEDNHDDQFIVDG